jgi:hypothetical protein
MMVASTAATITTAAISAGAGLVGVFAGSTLSTRREREVRKEGAVRALNIAALRCLARAHKIEAAERGMHEKAAEDRSNEIYHLGSDLDTSLRSRASKSGRCAPGTGRSASELSPS